LTRYKKPHLSPGCHSQLTDILNDLTYKLPSEALINSVKNSTQRESSEYESILLLFVIHHRKFCLKKVSNFVHTIEEELK